MKKTFFSENDHTVSETGNWNVADSFAKFKIMRPMINCEIYEDAALYGFDSFFEELVSYNVAVDELRIRGLQRLINELIRLSKNTMFAMKKPGTEKEMIKLKKSLEQIREGIFPHTHKSFVNQGAGIKGLKINNPLFNKTLEVVSAIKSQMNKPLNKNHLIFVDREEFDPKAFKERIKHRIVNKG